MKENKDNLIEEKVSIKSVKEAAQYSNFAQWFKVLVWGKMEGNQLPEKALDEIAKKLFEREKETYAQARREAVEECIEALPTANNPANAIMDDRREGENHMRKVIIAALEKLKVISKEK